ncbi:MAG: hypothetical protein HZA93_07200 [Verrucomicrobia bacterium]|nr:hypothetical protein [Verrucomicrobiota bacterium]
MNLRLFLLPLACAVTLLAGCASASLDLRPETDPNRVLRGTVNFRSEKPLPADAEIYVRVIDPSSTEQTRLAASRDLPVQTRAQVPLMPTILAEQRVPLAAGFALPFQIEFTASDEVMRRGVNVEARISFGGAVRYRTISAHLVTLSNVARNPYEVWVMSAGR